MTAKNAIERELKFRVADAFELPYLGGGGLRHVVVGRRTLDATYWDTPDLRLARRGHTLRFRTSDDGSERTWTLKLAGRGDSALLQRREINREGNPDTPPLVLVEALRGITGRCELVAIAQLRSRENQYRIEDAEGRRLLTVEDDRVQLIDRERIRGTLREVEVELDDPARGSRALARTARRLRKAGAGEPDPTSKLAHALGPRAHQERAPALRRTATVEELIRFTVRDGLEQLLRHDPGVRLDLATEDVHQARIATRRLRANLRTLRPLLARDQVDELRREIAWAGGLLGQVRDLDVLHGVFADALDTQPEDAATLLAVVDDERGAAHRCLVDAMRSPRWQSMLDILDAAAVMPPHAPDIVPTSQARRVIRPLLHKSWRRLERRVDAAQADDATWHDVRKSAKSLRYASELFEPFLGDHAERLSKTTERVQTQLGKEQDSLVARAWLANHDGDEQVGSIVRELADHFDDPHDRRPAHWKPMWKRVRLAAAPIT